MSLPTLALSVRQPWAWAIIHAGKNFENRLKRAITLGGMKKGRICIHASKGMTRDEYESARVTINRIAEREPLIGPNAGKTCPLPPMLVRGAIIGTVDVVAIVNEAVSPWFVGPWALVLEDPEPCDPIPVAGELGYFDWQKNTGKSWSAQAIEAPLPWMTAWPGDHRPGRAPRPRQTPEPELFAPPQQGEKP
ncbi:MAG: hypothetical protein BroJett013_06680 [Alphaproteobacteria bacterium]|mgnify:CR=1 FL=1|nr:MAG: hypothetical protein BroJett013_06680 [Alphaproteobacteria bacterium]